MSTILYSSIQNNIPENVKAYVRWGEQRLKQKPDVDLYKKLLDAYQFLGDKARYCSVAKTGTKLYPRNGRIQNAVDFCRY